MDEAAFERLVAEALDSLPEEFLRHMENVDVVVEQWPSKRALHAAGLRSGDRDHLLGLYVGVPLTERGHWYGEVLPDRIVLFQQPIERLSGDDPESVKGQVRRTVVHEVAHYYGISDERLDEMGWG